MCVCVLMHACLRMYGGMYPHDMGYVSVYMCECVHESNLVFYTQSTIMFISGQGKREKLGVLRPVNQCGYIRVIETETFK